MGLGGGRKKTTLYLIYSYQGVSEGPPVGPRGQEAEVHVIKPLICWDNFVLKAENIFEHLV